MKDKLAKLLFETRNSIFQPAQELAIFTSYKPRRGWLRLSREILGFKSRDLARQIGVTPASYTAFEKRELDGTITLKSLRAVAEAMDCELVYFIRPKHGETYTQRIWEQIEDDAHAKAIRILCPEHMRQHQLAAVASGLFTNAKYRREKGWGALRKRRRD